jgi:hypothetical protein
MGLAWLLRYLITAIVQNVGIASAFAYADNLLAAAPVGLLGLLLLFQVSIP